MKICEYDNVRCPYCNEEDKLEDVGYVYLDREQMRIPTASLGPWHYIRCAACSGVFIISCED
jgi:hypothetical protein